MLSACADRGGPGDGSDARRPVTCTPITLSLDTRVDVGGGGGGGGSSRAGTARGPGRADWRGSTTQASESTSVQPPRQGSRPEQVPEWRQMQALALNSHSAPLARRETLAHPRCAVVTGRARWMCGAAGESARHDERRAASARARSKAAEAADNKLIQQMLHPMKPTAADGSGSAGNGPRQLTLRAANAVVRVSAPLLSSAARLTLRGQRETHSECRSARVPRYHAIVWQAALAFRSLEVQVASEPWQLTTLRTLVYGGRQRCGSHSSRH
jgi:hypothetical protein